MAAVYRYSLLLATVLLVLLVSLPTYAQILGGGHCRMTFVQVPAGGMVCERRCYQRDYRGPPLFCRRFLRSGGVPVCGNGCCISGPNCFQLLRT